MAFGPFTLADFQLVCAGIMTEAGAGNPPTTPHQQACAFPNGTGAGDQSVTTPPVDTTQSIVALCDHTTQRKSRMVHTSDTSKQILTGNMLGANANGRVSFCIFAPPLGVIV